MNLIPNNNQTMSSREIAELTNKPHNDTLKAIRKMEEAWHNVTGGNFPLSEYTDVTGRKLPEYILTKTECLYIATKFNDEARAKLIIRWQQLEQKQHKPNIESITRKDLAVMLLESEEEKEALQLENQKLRPRSEFVDRVFQTSTLLPMSKAAKVLKLPYGSVTLYRKMRENKIFFMQGGSNEPYQTYINKGYFVLKQNLIDHAGKPPFISVQILVTQKGLAYISKVLGLVTTQVGQIRLGV